MFAYILDPPRANRTGDLDLNSQPNWSERTNGRFRSISASNGDKTGLPPSPPLPPLRHNRRALVTSCLLAFPICSSTATTDTRALGSAWFRKAPVIASKRYRDPERSNPVGFAVYPIKARFLVHEDRLSTWVFVFYATARNIMLSLITCSTDKETVLLHKKIAAATPHFLETYMPFYSSMPSLLYLLSDISITNFYIYYLYMCINLNTVA